MQKPIKINYRSSCIPFIFLIANAMFALAVIVLLRPNYALLWLLMLMTFLLFSWRDLRRTVPEMVMFDGKLWWLTIAGVRLQASISHHSFFCRYYIVLVFKLDKRNCYVHFSRDNCSEDDFRTLSRMQ